MSSLEGLEELREDLLLSLLAGEDIGMLVGGVDSADIVDVDHTTAIRVHLVEGSHDNSLTGSAHGSTDGAEEFVVLDQTATIEVHMGEEGLDFTLGEAEHVVTHSLAEFELVEGKRVVVIHDTELLGKADDTAGTTALQLVAEFLEEILTTGTATGGGTTDISLEDLTGELTVVQGTAAILVVKIVKSVQIL